MWERLESGDASLCRYHFQTHEHNEPVPRAPIELTVAQSSVERYNVEIVYLVYLNIYRTRRTLPAGQAVIKNDHEMKM